MRGKKGANYGKMTKKEERRAGKKKNSTQKKCR